MKHTCLAIILSLLISNNAIPLPAQEKIQAQSANEFLNSIGVNSAIFRRGETLAQTIECIKYLGARWIRTDESMNTDEKVRNIKELHEQTGVQISTSLGSGGNDIAGLVAGSKRIAALVGIELTEPKLNLIKVIFADRLFQATQHALFPVALLPLDVVSDERRKKPGIDSCPLLRKRPHQETGFIQYSFLLLYLSILFTMK